jgi:hypothetical protein
MVAPLNLHNDKPTDVGVNILAETTLNKLMSEYCNDVVVIGLTRGLARRLRPQHGEDSAFLKEPLRLGPGPHPIAGI